MKELSFLMLLIAVTVILRIFIYRLFKLSPKGTIYFYFPDSSRFNIVWGFIFYAGYGFITGGFWLRLAFGFLITGLTFYLMYLYLMKSFLSGHNTPINSFLAKVCTKKLDMQKESDKKYDDEKYSKEKALKVMGLASFALNSNDLLKKRLQFFKNLQSSMRIKHPYLGVLIKELARSLNIK